MGHRLTIENFEIEFCNGCTYYGEPNGCNRPNGTCDAYTFMQDIVSELEAYRACFPLERSQELAAKCELADDIFRQMANVIYNATQGKRLTASRLMDFMVSWCRKYERDTGTVLDIVDHREAATQKGRDGDV